MARTYKLRRFQNGRNQNGDSFWNYSLTVPTHIAEKLPKDTQYECEVDEDGIHFRPMTAETRRSELPSWAQAEEPPANGHEPEKPKRRARPGKQPA